MEFLGPPLNTTYLTWHIAFEFQFVNYDFFFSFQCTCTSTEIDLNDYFNYS